MTAAGKKTSRQQQFIYIIAGKDTALVDTECDRLLGELIEPEQRATGLLNIDADSANAAEVMDELRTLPFLTTRRVVVLKNADKFISANRELLEAYLDRPSPTGILVMTVGKLDSRTRLARKLPAVGKLITVNPPGTYQLPARLRQYAAEAHGKKLPTASAELLVELAGEDLTRLYSELDKLALFVGDKKTIEAEDVNSLVGHNRLYNAFDVINSVIDRDTAGAVNRLRRLFAQDRTEEYRFIGAFAYHLRRMFNAAVMLDKGKPEWVVKKACNIRYNPEVFFANLRKTSLAEIGNMIACLARADYEVKTGRINVRAAAERLVTDLAEG